MFGREKPAANQQQKPPTQQAAGYAQGQAPAAGAARMETVIGPNCRMSGILQSDGGVRIEGVFEGQIQTTGNLVVSETAKVLAEVQAYNVVVSGSLKGNVTANRLEILETGKLWGDLNVNALTLMEGAYLRGQTNMHGDVEPPMIEAPKFEPLKPASAQAELADGS